MFAVVLPLAPLLALIRCLAEIFIDHQKLLRCRRPPYIDRYCRSVAVMVSARFLNPTTPNSTFYRFVFRATIPSVGYRSPFVRLAEHLTLRLALGASMACLVGENPTCSVPPLQGCEGLWSYDYGHAWHEYTPPRPHCSGMT